MGNNKEKGEFNVNSNSKITYYLKIGSNIGKNTPQSILDIIQRKSKNTNKKKRNRK